MFGADTLRANAARRPRSAKPPAQTAKNLIIHGVILLKVLKNHLSERATGRSGFHPFIEYFSESMSQAFIQMSAVFAELELAIIRARVRSGMKSARDKGVKVGRKPTTKDDIPAIFYKHYPAFVAKQMNVSELARVCDLSRPTVYKYLKLIV